MSESETFPARIRLPANSAIADEAHAMSADLPVGSLAVPVSLPTLQRAPMPLARILRIGVSLATALQDLHAQGIVHGRLRPDCIDVVGEAAVRLRRPSAEPLFADLTASLAEQERTFGYIAPEQIHRNAREIDARADLYALGCLLYELLTGVLPFPDDDPYACLHGHIARRPLSAHERSTGVPRAISAIVDKLLSKGAEDRYQTAAGLRRDLDRCLYALATTGRIDQFVLAEGDVPTALYITDRLYGREPPVSALVDGFHRLIRTGRKQLMLVSGASGVGKTAAVLALSHHLPPGRSLFAVGKFDRGQSGIPYRTLSLAFGSLVEQVLHGPASGAAAWADRLREAVDDNAPLMVGLVPQLAALVGSQPPGVDYPAPELQARFWIVLKRVLQVFAQENRPLVLFLDDLQWADLATLSLLSKLASDDEVRYLMVVGAYRDGEVDEHHPLSSVRAAWHEAGTDPLDLRLGALTFEDIASLLADSLQSSLSAVLPLAELIHERTGGNAFMVHHLLRRLSDDGLVTLSSDRRQWSWDIARIRAGHYGEHAEDLLASAIGNIGPANLAVLQVLACLGNTATADLVERASDLEATEVCRALDDAVARGLAITRGAAYSFVHDRVREATYQSVRAVDLPALHARIGLNLAKGRAWTEDDEGLFEIVTQLNRGVMALAAEQRPWLATLNAAAGARARKTAAYGPALGYFEAAAEALRGGPPPEDHALGFTVELRRAECEFLLGAIDTADKRLAELAARTTDVFNAAAVAWTRVTLDTAAGRFDLAVERALAYLRSIGIAWTAKPSRADLDEEFKPIATVIANGTIETLIDLPANTHDGSTTTLDVLTALLPPAFFTDNTLVCLVLCRMVNLTLEHGTSAASSLAYAYLGMVLGPFFGDYDAGYRFGRLGLALALERGHDRYAARVSMCFGAHVLPFTQPLSIALPHLRRAFAAADRAGDLTYAGFSACTTVTNLIGTGTDLASVQREAESKLTYVRRARFGLIEDIITTQLQLARALAGVTPDVMVLDDPTFSEQRFEKHLCDDPQLLIAACWYWIRKAQHRVIIGDHAAAVAAVAQAEPLLWTTGGHFEFAEFHLFAALARTAAFDAASAEEKHALRAAAEGHLAQLRVWERSCPSTFAHRAALVAGELARIAGDDLEALRCFEEAARSAGPHNLLGAFALQRASLLCGARGLPMMSVAFRRRAREAYRHCGAEGMVRRLAGGEDDAREEPRQPALANENVTLGDTELAAVVRSFEALTEQVALDQLVRTLMVIALQHAGAERGLLVMRREADLMVEAEARAGAETVEVQIGSAPVISSDLPLSVLRIAIDTRQAIVISDVKISHSFQGDPYFADHQSRSVLCLPLVRQGAVTGALFLENGLLPNVFDGVRTAVLKIMASQAAIALENASLGEKEALLREVHHRVKNNLQLVSSLLNLQAAQIPDPKVAELFTDSRNRVRAMALVHENLYRAGNFSSIVMSEHVRTLCAHVMRAYGGLAQNVRLEVVAADDIRLDVDRAVSCGLIINELVSNALKHAFPADRPGRISIGLALKGDQRCILSIADDGIGLPSPIDGGGDTLGLQLVYDLAAQLNGTVDCYRNEGTFFTIAFPVSRARKLTH